MNGHMEVKVMIYNIHHGQGRNGRSNLERVAEVVRACGADIVGFNEVDRFFGRRSGFVDQYAWLADRLGMHGAFGASITRRKGAVVREYGNAVLSRFPIVSHRNHGYRARGLIVSEPRAVLEADVELGLSRPLKLFVTHLSFIPVLQRIQIELMAARFGKAPAPAVLMGDMNMRPGQVSWRKLARLAQDAGRDNDGQPLPTFPSTSPVTQKDYIFATREIRVIASGTDASAPDVSDHLPLWAVLDL